MKAKHKEAIDAARRALHELGIYYEQPTDATTGTIFLDEANKRNPQTGLQAFLSILREKGLCRRIAHETKLSLVSNSSRPQATAKKGDTTPARTVHEDAPYRRRSED